MSRVLPCLSNVRLTTVTHTVPHMWSVRTPITWPSKQMQRQARKHGAAVWATYRVVGCASGSQLLPRAVQSTSRHIQNGDACCTCIQQSFGHDKAETASATCYHCDARHVQACWHSAQRHGIREAWIVLPFAMHQLRNSGLGDLHQTKSRKKKKINKKKCGKLDK